MTVPSINARDATDASSVSIVPIERPVQLAEEYRLREPQLTMVEAELATLLT